MSTTDGASDQKLIYDLEWKYYCLLPKTVMQMKHLPSAKFYLSLSTQIKQHTQGNYATVGSAIVAIATVGRGG